MINATKIINNILPKKEISRDKCSTNFIPYGDANFKVTGYISNKSSLGKCENCGSRNAAYKYQGKNLCPQCHDEMNSESLRGEW